MRSAEKMQQAVQKESHKVVRTIYVIYSLGARS